MSLTAFDRFCGTARFASLDGLRCLAIVPVVWHHATLAPREGVLGRGPLGVDLFFVISGFLITTLLLRERETTGDVSLTSFYARRSLRIFPLYYLVLALFVLHAWVLREPGPVRDHFLRSAPFYATYTSNWFVDFGVPHAIVFSFAWSLATEEQFYLVWPWIGSGRSRALAAAFMALVVLVDQAAERGLLDGWLAASPLALRMLRSISTPIGLGSLLALGLRSPRVFRWLFALLGRRISAPLALAALLAIAILGWPLLSAHLAMVALVGACVIREDHGIACLLEQRAIAHVGVVSYGIYLLNVPAVVASRRALGGAEAPTWLVFLAALAGSIAVASVARRFVEEPFLRLRARFSAGGRERTRPGANRPAILREGSPAPQGDRDPRAPSVATD